MSSSSFQQHSRRMALCGLMATLSVVFLLFGSVIPLATFACPMLAMVCLLPVLREYGPKFALILYAAVSILALLLAADKELALFYAFLGYYPVLLPVLDRLRPRLLRLGAKCGIFFAAMAAMYLLILYLFRLDAIREEFAGYSAGLILALLLLGNLTFLMMDRALAILAFLYDKKLRRRFFH